MKTVYSSPYIADCDQVRVALSLAGIESELRNEYGNPIGLVLIGGVVGFTWPEVWVADENMDAAQPIVAGFIARLSDTRAAADAPPPLSDWRCPRCGETVDGTLGACWLCSTERPA